jgi:plastocyanin
MRVVADDRSFKSPVLDIDGQFSRQFTQPGTFKYSCHPSMTGTVVVA